MKTNRLQLGSGVVQSRRESIRPLDSFRSSKAEAYTIGAFLLFFVGVGFSGSQGVLTMLLAVKIGFACLLMFERRPENLIPLAILTIPAIHFSFPGTATVRMAGGADFNAVSLSIGGLPLTIGSSIALLIIAVLFFEILEGGFFRFVLQSNWIRLLFFFWVAALVFSAFASLKGLSHGEAGWSHSFRAVTALGFLFYGLLLCQRIGSGTLNLVRRLVLLFFLVLSILFAFGFGMGKIAFAVSAFAPALLLLSSGSRPIVRTIVVATVVLVGMREFGIGRTGTATLTHIGSYSFALAFTLFLIGRKSSLRVSWMALRPLVFGAGIACIVIPFYLALSFDDYHIEVTSARSDDLASRLESKLLNDRLTVWFYAVEGYKEDNWLVPTGGAPFFMPDHLGRWRLWDNGAHNLFIEQFRHGGIVVGVFFILFWMWIVMALGKSAFGCKNNLVRFLCVGALAIAVVGCFTGDYPMREDIALWWAGGGGLAIGLARRYRGIGNPSSAAGSRFSR